MLVTTRNGHYIEECLDTEANRDRLKARYGRDYYLFTAETSRTESVSPLRRAITPRKFTVSE